MDQRHTYEQTITSKLDILPLPDMADAIWSRIEQQLDTDMPTDDGSNGPAPSSPTPKLFIGGSVFVVLVALVSFFLLRKTSTQQRPTINTTPAPAKTEIQVSKPPGESPPKSFQPDKEVQNNPIRVLNTSADSFAAIPGFNLIDSLQKQDALVETPPPVILPPKDSAVQGKKKRGVSGLNDNDYRVVPKKDSSR